MKYFKITCKKAYRLTDRINEFIILYYSFHFGFQKEGSWTQNMLHFGDFYGTMTYKKETLAKFYYNDLFNINLDYILL